MDQILALDKEVRHIVVIEPDLAVFNNTMKTDYIADLLDHDKVDFILGVTVAQFKAQLFQLFTNLHPKYGSRASTCQHPEVIPDPFIYSDRGIKKIDDGVPYIHAASETAKQSFLAMGCSADSYNRFEQTVRNEENIKTKPEIKHLFKKFTDFPAIIVGAGPSMESFIKECHKNKVHEKSLVIACDASLKRLLKEGIRPHLVTRCERKSSTIFNGVEDYDLRGIYYAAYPWTPPEYFDLFPDSFMLFRDNGVCKWTGFDPGSVNGGVSSANAALELALMFGCRDIYLTGIDLCMVGGQTHVGGTEVEFDPEKSKDKWTEVRGNTHKKVTTIPVWARCLNEYNTAIYKWQGKTNGYYKIFNTSKDGAYLEAAPYMAWNKVKLTKKLDPLPIIKENIKTPDQFRMANWTKTKFQTKKLYERFLLDVEKLGKFIEDAMVNCTREEEKIVDQCKSQFLPKPFFETVENNKNSLREMYKGQCVQIDTFRQTFFTDKLFCDTLIDLCQLETFQAENKINSLRNIIRLEHERMKAYITLHYSLFKIYEYYAKKIIGLCDKGWVSDEPEKMVEEFNKGVGDLHEGARA